MRNSRCMSQFEEDAPPMDWELGSMGTYFPTTDACDDIKGGRDLEVETELGSRNPVTSPTVRVL